MAKNLVKLAPASENATRATESLVRQSQVAKLLMELPTSEALSVSLAFLLHCAYNHRPMFRRVMREPVHREGFRGISLLEAFKRQSW
jgi:hypothetical protein